MRHRVFGKHLGRNTGQRNALRRTLITQLFTHERIRTTSAKADAIRAEAEHMITMAKRTLGNPDPSRRVHVQRLLVARLDDPSAAKKVFDVLAPRYKERPGGYTRIYKLGPRKGDNADMVLLELVDRGVGSNTDETDAAASTGRTRGLLNRIRRPRANQGEAAAAGEAKE